MSSKNLSFSLIESNTDKKNLELLLMTVWLH